MRHSPLTIDGLWYCLYPSFRQSYLQRPSLSFKCTRTTPRRFVSSALRTSRTSSTSLHPAPHKVPEDHESQKPENLTSRSRHLPLYTSLSASELENLLERSSTRRETDILRIVDILKVLLHTHHISPTTRHYRAYILGNIDRRYGSPRNIRSLLQEMEKEGITADSATLHAALEALAVYPNHALRQEVLGALRARWLSLSPAGWHHLITGLVREGQLELALDRLDQMERKGIALEQWLHSLLVYKLCDSCEFTEVLHLMRSRSKKAEYISPAMWSYLLRAAIRSYHFDTVRYVWTNAVDLGYTALRPSDCRDILRLASEYGDISFSESAFRHLFRLQRKLEPEDYENLVHAYALNGDIKTSLEMICRMHEKKLPLSPQSTQPVLQLLETKMNDPEAIWKEITELNKKGLKIPVALANLAISYSAISFQRGALSASRATNVAIDIYKDLFEVCSSGANIETFNSLFTLCHKTGRPDACTFFAKEMAAFEVPPDQQTLQTLMLICLEAGNFHAASMYLTDLQARGWDLSSAVLDEVYRKCQNTVDRDAAILSQMLRR